jgi:hypothetical protein
MPKVPRSNPIARTILVFFLFWKALGWPASAPHGRFFLIFSSDVVWAGRFSSNRRLGVIWPTRFPFFCFSILFHTTLYFFP